MEVERHELRPLVAELREESAVGRELDARYEAYQQSGRGEEIMLGQVLKRALLAVAMLLAGSTAAQKAWATCPKVEGEVKHAILACGPGGENTLLLEYAAITKRAGIEPEIGGVCTEAISLLVNADFEICDFRTLAVGPQNDAKLVLLLQHEDNAGAE